jgi:hypothetical protein
MRSVTMSALIRRGMNRTGRAAKKSGSKMTKWIMTKALNSSWRDNSTLVSF